VTESELPRARAQAIIESILLAAEEPVLPARLCELLDGHKLRDVREMVAELNRHYQENGHGLAIVEVAGGYQFATRAELGAWVRRYHRDRTTIRLSQAALEALAIIAFKQPVTRVEIDNIRGVSSTGVLQKLMELDLIRLVGRSEGVGRPMLFGTTKEFLIHFGLNSLADLPRPRELEELLAAGEQKAQERQRGEAPAGLALPPGAADGGGPPQGPAVPAELTPGASGAGSGRADDDQQAG